VVVVRDDVALAAHRAANVHVLGRINSRPVGHWMEACAVRSDQVSFDSGPPRPPVEDARPPPPDNVLHHAGVDHDGSTIVYEADSYLPLRSRECLAARGADADVVPLNHRPRNPPSIYSRQAYAAKTIKFVATRPNDVTPDQRVTHEAAVQPNRE